MSSSQPSAPPLRSTRPRSNSLEERAQQEFSDTDATVVEELPDYVHLSSPRVQQVREKEEEELKCWICHVTTEEEEENRGDWRSPCKCTLIAHEGCLLDWVQTQESDHKSLACPLCKTPIKLHQDQSWFLEAAKNVDNTALRVGATVAIAGVGGLMYVGCTIYGVNAVYNICGPELAGEILLNEQGDFDWTWRLATGLPIIPSALILSRVRIADTILLILPLVFFGHTGLHFTWPLTPHSTFAVLPYIRLAYNHGWNTMVKPYEDKWIKEAAPHYALENAEAEAEAARQEAEQPRPWQRMRRRRARNPEAPPEAMHEPAHPGAVDFDNILLEEDWNGQIRMNRQNVMIGENNALSLILGALLWPTASRFIGSGVLGNWPALLGGNQFRRWFPNKLARNVLGGLVLVLFKDIFCLYRKYKRAQQHRTRKILNYEEEDE